MLIHATVTISGDPVMRAACEARLRRLLSGLYLKNEVTEHHGNDALCYDLKVGGGIPFPLFAQASQEFPGLKLEASWVNVAAGESGKATIIDGRVLEQESARMASGLADDHPVHVEVGPDGKLGLALSLFRATRDEWRGYALTATRDALLLVRRAPGSDTAELLATEGAPEWSAAWRGTMSPPPARDTLVEPVAIEDSIFQELDALARDFAARWIWFAADRPEIVAVETERYARYGYAMSAANILSSRLHRMRSGAAAGAPLLHSTLDDEERWIKDFVLATWARHTTT